METLDAYLQRKSREIALLEACLTTRLNLPRPTSPAEIIKQKFQIASALKAEYAIKDCAVYPKTAYWEMNTRAAAHAEVGEFKEALEWQTRAMQSVPAYLRADYQQRLDLYKAGMPYREKTAKAQ